MGGWGNKTNLEETKKLKCFKLQSELLFEENKRPEDEKSGQGFFFFVDNLQVWGEKLQKRDWRELPNYIRIWEER